MQPLKLFSHQIESVRLFQGRERGLDLSDPGTGKTAVQISLFADRRRHGGGKALILAPKSLLRATWVNDFAKFAPDMRVVAAYATTREDILAVGDFDAVALNIDSTRWLVKQKPSIFKDFDTIIIDEISHYKHATSQRSKGLAKIRKHFKYRYGLTGTLNANTILDCWHPAFLIDDGDALGTSFFAFRNNTCIPTQVGPGVQHIKWTDRPGIEGAVSSLLKPISVRHKFEDCVSIPENMFSVMSYQLGHAQELAYKKMKRECVIHLTSGDQITAINAAAMTTKLLQIASGASYSEQNYAVLGRERYEMVADLIDQRKHCVVFFQWKHQKEELISEFEARGITYCVLDGSSSDMQRAQAVEMFQKGMYKVFLAHPQSAGYGLTLTRATTTIWASPTYNLDHFLQGNRRIYRTGQTQKTETIIIIAERTIEEKVYEAIKDKDSKQVSLLELLQTTIQHDNNLRD